MATQIPVGLSEVIQAYIVSALEAKALEQAGLDASNMFYVFEDVLIALDSSDSFPLVVVQLDSLNTEVSKSTSYTYQTETASFSLDCYAIGDQAGAAQSDVSGVSRVRYLKEQVKYVLTSLLHVDFGLPVGTISQRKWPSFQMFKPESSSEELTIAAGRWVFSVSYKYSPEDYELLDLSQINAHTNNWDTLFTY